MQEKSKVQKQACLQAELQKDTAKNHQLLQKGEVHFVKEKELLLSVFLEKLEYKISGMFLFDQKSNLSGGSNNLMKAVLLMLWLKQRELAVMKAQEHLSNPLQKAHQALAVLK